MWGTSPGGHSYQLPYLTYTMYFLKPRFDAIHFCFTSETICETNFCVYNTYISSMAWIIVDREYEKKKIKKLFNTIN